MNKSYNVAAAMLATLLVTSSTAVLAQTASTPLADRAATLGGQVFKVEHTPADYAGVTSRHWVASADVANENPLADRAATLGGKVFTAEGADGTHYAVAAVNDAEANRVFGTPLKDRAETLGGKAFTVERVQSSSPHAASFLARFQ